MSAFISSTAILSAPHSSPSITVIILLSLAPSPSLCVHLPPLLLQSPSPSLHPSPKHLGSISITTPHRRHHSPVPRCEIFASSHALELSRLRRTRCLGGWCWRGVLVWLWVLGSWGAFFAFSHTFFCVCFFVFSWVCRRRIMRCAPRILEIFRMPDSRARGGCRLVPLGPFFPVWVSAVPWVAGCGWFVESDGVGSWWVDGRGWRG